jgi:hypothetical protein
MVWYTGDDLTTYNQGDKFVPLERFTLPYERSAPVEEEEENVITSYGIPNTNAFVNTNNAPREVPLSLTYDPTADGSNTVKDEEEEKESWFSSLFSRTPRVRGTLGTRLANAPRIPFPAALASWSLSPFNKKSRNYNPDFEDQLNYLEMQGAPGDYIGIDPNSGLYKYGPKSVLSGENVMSLAGSNNYAKQLARRKEWFQNRIYQGKPISWKNYQKVLEEQETQFVDNPGEGIKDYDPTGPTQKSIRESRPDKSGQGHSGGFTDPGKGSYGPHKADGGRVYLNLGGLASMLGREYFKEGGKARIGFFKGAQADTKEGKAMSPGTSATGGLRTGADGPDNKDRKKLTISPVIDTKWTDLGFEYPTGVFGFDALTPFGKLKATANLKNYITGDDVEPTLDYQGNIGPVDINATYSNDVQNINATINNNNWNAGINYDAITGDPTFGINYSKTFKHGGLASIL